jgi:hypothetical protein
MSHLLVSDPIITEAKGFNRADQFPVRPDVGYAMELFGRSLW